MLGEEPMARTSVDPHPESTELAATVAKPRIIWRRDNADENLCELMEFPWSCVIHRLGVR